MQVILLERIEKLGFIGDTVTVKNGFARNYLLPQKKALRATKENLTYFDQQKAHIEAENLKSRKDAEKVADRLKGMALTVIRQAGDSGQLYGSVTAKDIEEFLSSAEKVDVRRSQIVIHRPIKMLGLHQIQLKLHPEVRVTIVVNVAKSEEEAEAQLRGEVPAQRKAQAETGEAAEEVVSEEN